MACSTVMFNIFVFSTFLYTVVAVRNDIEHVTKPPMTFNLENSTGHTEKFSAAKVCGCSLEISPVCASNGATFKNLCTLECENQRRRENDEEQLYVKCNYDCIVCVLIEWYKRAT